MAGGSRITTLVLAACLALALVPGALADALSGRLTTLPYFHEEPLPGEDLTCLALYQFLDLRATGLSGVPGLEVYLSAWGRADAAARRDREGRALGDGEVESAYLRWMDEDGIFDLSLGRRFVRLAGAAERIDGLQAHVEPVPWVGMQAFGGVPAASEAGNRDGDWAYGARLWGAWRPGGEIGVSYASFIEENQPDREMIGGDVTATPAPWIDVLGHAYFDALYGSFYDARATIALRPATDLKVLLQYDRVMPSAYLGMHSYFSVFTFATVSEARAEARYVVGRRLALMAEYGHLWYDERDPADRWGGSVGLRWGGLREHTAQIGARRLGGDAGAYTEVRACLVQGVGEFLYGALDLTGAFLDDATEGEDLALAGSLSLGWRAPEGIDLQASAFYVDGPYGDDEFRGLLKISCNIDRTFGEAR